MTDTTEKTPDSPTDTLFCDRWRPIACVIALVPIFLGFSHCTAKLEKEREETRREAFKAGLEEKNGFFGKYYQQPESEK